MSAAARSLLTAPGRLAATALLSAACVHAQATWDPSNSSWATSGNWDGGVPQNDTVATFTYKTNNKDPYISGAAVAGKLVFTGNTDSESFTGSGSLTLYGVGGIGIDVRINRATSFATDLAIAGDQTWMISSTSGGSITTTSAASLNLGSNTLTLSPTASVTSMTFNGSILGTGNLIAAGAGTTTLTANNSYSGTTTINSGATLRVGTGSTTGTLGTGDVINNGALSINRSNAVTVSNTISGSGSLTKAGSGTVTLTGDNIYTGTTTISAGTLQVGAGSTSGSLGTGQVVNNGALVLNRSDSVTMTNVVSGTGSVTQNGTGTVTIGGSNTYTGATVINDGVLAAGTIANGGTTSSLGRAASSANNLVLDGGTLRYTGASASTNRLFSIGTAGGVIDTGTGSLSFTNTGALGFNGETGNRTLELTGSGSGSLTSVLGNNSGSTSLIKSGTGTWTLRGNNTYSGTTSINAGTLIAANAGALGSSSATTNVSAGAALGLSGGVTTTSGGLSLIGDGVGSSGALYNVSGSNRFSGTINLRGDTTIGADAGALTLSNAINLDSAVAANTTLSFKPESGSTIDVTGTIADNNNDSYWLNVANTGNGTLRLSNGGNTYAGDTIIGTAGGSTTGTIQLGADDALPLPSYYIEVPNIRVYSGTLDLNNYSATALGNLMIGGGASSSTASVTSGTGVLTLTKNLLHTAGGTATISANLELTSGSHEFRIEDSTNAADLTISGTISGSGVLNKTSAGTLVLSGANTYTGTTILNAGRVVVQNNSALGATGESYYTSVSSGAAVQLDGSVANLSVGERFTIAGSGIQGTGAIQNLKGSNTLSSGITVTTQNTRIQSEEGSSLTITGGINAMTGGSLQVAGAGNTSISGDIAQSVGGIDKRGSGTLTLSGGNVFTGPVNVQEGTLSVRSDSALGDNTNVVSVKSGATLAFETGAAGNILVTRGSGVTLEGGTIRSVTGANLYNPSVNLTSASTIVANTGASFAIGGNLTASNSSATVRIGESTQSGNVTVSGTIGTNGATLEKVGGGKLTLAQGGSVGALAVNGGSLALNSGTLSASSLSLAGGTSLLIAGGGTISVSGATTIAGGTLSSSINGYLSIRGNTTVTFTGSNTATGLTLKVGGTTSGSMAGAIRVNLGDALTIGTLEITGDTILDFGNSATTVLTSNNLIISNANAKIQVINWVGTSTSTSDIWYALSTIGTTTTNGRPLGSTNDTSAPLPQIEFYQPGGNTGSTTTWVADGGNWHGHEIRPTPEPATYGALLISGCLSLFGWRRWRRNKAQSQA